MHAKLRRKDAKRALMEAVLQVFYEPSSACRPDDLARFPLELWQTIYHWLDSNGIALYFLDRVKELGREALLPTETLRRLQGNLQENRLRNAALLDELKHLSRAFTQAGLKFAHLKGLTLVPYACADFALRQQQDLDFLIYAKDADACRHLLGERGYLLTAAGPRTWEFKTGSPRLPEIGDLYKPKTERAVDLQFEAAGAPSRLDRIRWRMVGDLEVPTLDGADIFLLQARHLLQHLRSEWIRLSWLLEFRNSIVSRQDDVAFWLEVREKAAGDADLLTGIGAGMSLSAQVFGEFAQPRPMRSAIPALEPRMKLWLDRYGREAVLADFPGTKLYLLQPDLASGPGGLARLRRHRLFPLRRPPRMVTAGTNGVSDQLGRCSSQLKFIVLRLRFHIAQGWRYAVEAPRWKRILLRAERRLAGMTE
ncbi:MAG TPA: nucleotidyltransferase family protein [Acidobacteriaceae bacterium]|nr:nucleotidyltransferase family protein [Acidobacteriaceae bacterium]